MTFFNSFRKVPDPDRLAFITFNHDLFDFALRCCDVHRLRRDASREPIARVCAVAKPTGLSIDRVLELSRRNSLHDLRRQITNLAALSLPMVEASGPDCGVAAISYKRSAMQRQCKGAGVPLLVTDVEQGTS